VISELEEQINQLNQELEEERLEGNRKDAETGALSQRLKDKEKFLVEAGELLIEAQKHYEAQRNKAELITREKAAITGEFQNVQDLLQADLDKAKYDLQELEVTVDTLRMENKQMVKDIAEMSGDTAVDRTQGDTDDNKRSNSTVNRYRSDMNGSAFGEEKDPLPVVTGARVGEGSGAEIEGEKERKERIEKEKVALSSMCVEFGMSGPAADALKNWMEGMTSHHERSIKGFECRLGNVERLHSDQGKRMKDMETQRKRLETDLQNKTLKVTQLGIEINSIKTLDGQALIDLINEKDRVLSKSLQQRLEQLVAVHRQLLRKFAMFEIENGESKKKIQLRDERIRQLENGSRSLTINMRGRHLYQSLLTCIYTDLYI
jgi:kinesin family protein 5